MGRETGMLLEVRMECTLFRNLKEASKGMRLEPETQTILQPVCFNLT